MAGLRRVDEHRRQADAGERRGDFLSDEARFADAQHHQVAGAVVQQGHHVDEVLVDAVHQVGDRFAFDAQDAFARFDDLIFQFRRHRRGFFQGLHDLREAFVFKRFEWLTSYKG